MTTFKSISPAIARIEDAVLARVAIDGEDSLPDSVMTLPVDEMWPQCNILARYAPHLLRQASDLRVFQSDEDLTLDPCLDYFEVEGLSSEVRERLTRVRPISIVSCYAPYALHPKSKLRFVFKRVRQNEWRE